MSKIWHWLARNASAVCCLTWQMALVVLSLYVIGSASAYAVDAYIIYVKRDADTTAMSSSLSNDHVQHRQRGDLYKPFLTDPEQTFVHTRVGPLPLYFEAVYDANGHPKPRFPHFIAKQLLDDPTEEKAFVWLSAGEARFRRAKEAMNIVHRTAMKYGFVTPEDLTIHRDRIEHAEYMMPFEPAGSGNPSIWGFPLLEERGMRRYGFDNETHKPILPGGPPGGFVVLYFWDHRSKKSFEHMKHFVAFGRKLYNLGVNIDIKTIDTAVDDKNGFAGYIRFLESGDDTKDIILFGNYLDYTNLRYALRVTHVPTLFFIDRRFDRIRRVEGWKTVEEYEDEIDDFLGVKSRLADGTWRPDPEVFLTDRQRKMRRKMLVDYGYDDESVRAQLEHPEYHPRGSDVVPTPAVPDLAPWDPRTNWSSLPNSPGKYMERSERHRALQPPAERRKP